jgi:hypothetical protein
MGGGSPSKTTQTNKVELSPEQKKVFDLAFPYVQQYAQNPAQMYQGQTIADFDPAEIAGQNAALEAASGQGAQLGSAAADAQKFLMNPALLSPDSNPWLQQQGDAIARTMSDQLTKSILPSLRSGATMTGGMYSGGSSREALAQGLAAEGTARQTGDALANLYSNAYSTGLGTMTDALKLNPLTQQGTLFNSSVQAQVGAQRRAQQQAMLDEAAQRFNFQQMLPFYTAQDLLSMISGMPGGQGVSSVQGAQPKANPIMGGLGGAASGAALGSMIMPGFGTAIGAGLGLLGGLL